MIKRIKQHFAKKQEERTKELYRDGYEHTIKLNTLGTPIDTLREAYLKTMAEGTVDKDYLEGMGHALTYLTNKPQKVNDIPHLTKQAE